MGNTADTVFLGGKVFTGTGTEPVDAAVAVAGGRILAVGDTAEIRGPRAPARRSSTSPAGS
ncbi:imidazolonepropionase-like domain-containing protein [Yinghuangia aomiensis]